MTQTRVQVEYDIAALRYRIGVFRPAHGGGSEILRLGAPGHFDSWEPIEPGERIEWPTLFLEGDVLAALVAAASDHLPPSAATDRHLDDATAVRDRLLALVEHTIIGQVA